MWRPSSGTWFILTTTTAYGSSITRQFGLNGDIPLVIDFDHDGRMDFAVYRPSTGAWYSQDALLATTSVGSPFNVQWGTSADLPVPHDFDGDGWADLTVFRPSTGEWWIVRSTTGTGVVVSWGTPLDVPMLRTGYSRP